MKIREQWDGFLKEADEHTSFLQSWEWGEMQATYGRPARRFFAMDQGEPVAAAYAYEMPLLLGKGYLFSPRGPVMKPGVNQQAAYKALLLGLENDSNAIFWRFEPANCSPMDGAKRVPDVQPSNTRFLALAGSEDEMLAGMKQKTRYNIRLAERKGVEVAFVKADQDPAWYDYIDKMWELLEQTSGRHGIRHHPLGYYRTMVDVLGDKGMLEIAYATHEGTLLAMNIMIRYGDTMTYLHGASSQEKKQVMAPHLLQWRSIQRAKELGYNWYDFYGISPDGAKNHPFAGVTRYKAGFGGETHEYPGTFEFIFSRVWYTLYAIAKRVRRSV